MNDFMDALNEAAKVGSQQYYKTAQKNLTNVKNMLRPFLTGAKDFTAKDLDDISSLLNDENVSAVLGKNDKKALKAIQNVNGMIKNKKAALLQTQQTDTAANKGTTEKVPPANDSTVQDNTTVPSKDGKVDNTQDVSNETATDAKSPQQQTEQKGNAANVPEGNRNAIKVKLQGIAKELGQSEDDIIAYIKTL